MTRAMAMRVLRFYVELDRLHSEACELEGLATRGPEDEPVFSSEVFGAIVMARVALDQGVDEAGPALETISYHLADKT